MTPAEIKRRRALGDRLLSQSIVIDAIKIPLQPSTETMTMRTNQRLATNDPPTRYALPHDVPGAVKAITKALGLPDSATADDIRAAVEAVLAVIEADPTLPANIRAVAWALHLSQREIDMLIEKRCDPRKYVALKQQHQRGRRR